MQTNIENNFTAEKTMVQPLIRKMAFGIIILVLATIGFYAIGLYWDYVSVHNALLNFKITSKVSVDFYGGIIPFIVGSVATSIYFSCKFSAKKLLVVFIILLIFGFAIFHITEEGLAGYPIVFALLSGLASSLLMFSTKPFLETKRKMAASTLTSLSCAPLSIIAIDIVFIPLFDNATVGGNGLSDGVLISMLYSPLWAMLISALLLILIELGIFLEIILHRMPQALS